MTYKCIELARTKTKIDFQLVVVETGTAYMAEVADIYIYERDRTKASISYNRAFKLADGEYVTVLTNDVYVDDGWLEAMEECFDKYPDCGVATVGSNEAQSIKQDKIEEAVWASITMIRKDMLMKAAMFDTIYRHGSFEDTDQIMKIVLEGKKPYRNLKCVVEHLVHRTNGLTQEKHLVDYFYNRELFNAKYAPIAESMTPYQRELFEMVR